MTLSSGIIGLPSLSRPMSERSSAQLQKSNTPSNSLTTVLLPSSEAENNHSDLSLAISKTQAENKYFNRVEGAGSAPKAESSKVISKSFELPKTGNGIEEDGAEANTIHESQGVQSIIEQIQVRDMAMRLYEQARAATGIQHSAHLIFQSLNGQRYAADMEAASEERAKDARNGVNTIERTYLEDREIEKAKQEKALWECKRKIQILKKLSPVERMKKKLTLKKPGKSRLHSRWINLAPSANWKTHCLPPIRCINWPIYCTT